MIDTMFDVEVIAAAEGKTLRFSDGATIHERGDSAEHAYIVKRGRVEIRQKGRAVETIAPGEIFGELALLDHEPRGAGAVAVGDVELVTIDRSVFATLLRDDPDFALTVLRLLARRLRATTAMFEHCVDELPRADMRLVARASASA